jgi:glucokinase
MPRATLAAVGPGSGLGVAGLVPASDGWAPITGEGGHVSMPPQTAEEDKVVALLRERFGHCSAERVLSGPGLVNLYVALADLAGRGQPTVTAEDVTNLARQGEPLARKTLGMFCAMLGTVAADIALTTGSRGGVYIAGGIVPRFVDLFRKSEFRARFEAKGRYAHYLAAIPTFVVTAPLPAFRGLRHLLGYR